MHVYKVAPALTVIEKTVTRALANRFGFVGSHAGGISQSGGSGANLTALVAARNCLFPQTKTNGCGSRRLVLFTSAHGHYSFEKAANICGLGSQAVRSVPVDEQGRMSVPDLHCMISESRKLGETPFFVNATAGTTVLGSYDPLEDIGEVCRQEQLWFHVDASWGGSVVFSDAQRPKLHGAEKAQTLTVNPHKMLGVPLTCSFLLANDLRQLHNANTLPAAYLFHTSEGQPTIDSSSADDAEVWDLADLTLQCGRKGDALKMALSWVRYGSEGFSERIDHAFCVAQHLAELVEESTDIVLASTNPPPCLQVCFYFAPGGSLGTKENNSAHTRRIANALLQRDFLVDYAPSEHGLFFRVVVSLNTTHETVQKLVKAIIASGNSGS